MKLLKYTYLVFLVSIFVLAFLPSDVVAEKLRLNSGHNPPLATDDHTGFHDLVAIEAYKKLGIEIEIHRLPSARSGRNADQGIDDGNGPRISDYEKFFPNLVKVPEKVIDFDFVGFTLDPAINPKGWDDLASYNIGMVTGWKLIEVNAKKYKTLTKVRNTEQLFKLLKNGRADVVLIERWQGLYQAKQLGLDNIHVVEPPFAQKEMFFFLNKKHQALVPKLTQALRAMKEDGTYQRLVQAKLLPLVPKQ